VGVKDEIAKEKQKKQFMKKMEPPKACDY